MSAVFRILVVDDEPDVVDGIAAILEHEGHHVHPAHDGIDALAHLDRETFDLVLSDVRLPRLDGFLLLRKVRERWPRTDVVLMTGYARIEDAVLAIQEEASDYLAKPFTPEQLLAVISRIVERQRLSAEHAAARAGLDTPDAGHELVGESPVMVRLRERLVMIAESEATVLLTGESGTGKELAARLIHDRSSRAAGPFVAVNCAAFPASLLEAELFGHVRGAFTGAVRSRIGRFAAADRGTLFLDEVAELSLEAQAKLLRVIQEGIFQAIGSNDDVRVDVRVVAATHRNLKQRIAEARFREDLYYRIKVLEVHLPPLRQRRGDLPLLVEYFLRRHTPASVEAPTLSARAWAALANYPFPGNVRELEHAIQHALVLSRGRDITLHDLPQDVRGDDAQGEDVEGLPSLSAALRHFEREYISRALTITEGRRAQAARILGVSRKSLWKKIRDHQLTKKPREQ